MSTKQFKIGEYCRGGIIQVIITGELIRIDAIDYNSKYILLSNSFNKNDKLPMSNWLDYLTSSYYAEKVTNYINSKIQ